MSVAVGLQEKVGVQVKVGLMVPLGLALGQGPLGVRLGVGVTDAGGVALWVGLGTAAVPRRDRPMNEKTRMNSMPDRAALVRWKGSFGFANAGVLEKVAPLRGHAKQRPGPPPGRQYHPEIRHRLQPGRAAENTPVSIGYCLEVDRKEWAAWPRFAA